jgi:hypothetical protein
MSGKIEYDTLTTPQGFTFTENDEGLVFDGVAYIKETFIKLPHTAGTVSGYSSGGVTQYTIGQPAVNTVDKFPFATNGAATDVGDLTVSRVQTAGQSSSTSGYVSSGGLTLFGYSGGQVSNAIEKFPFATDTNIADVGDSYGSVSATGHSSTTHGYVVGGVYAPSAFHKFSFASDGNSSTVAPSPGFTNASGTSSETSGYITTIRFSSSIVKFPFATDSTTTFVGNITQGRYYATGTNSAQFGYASGGAPGSINTIDKFPFASDANATDVGDLTSGRYGMAGQSSLTHAYNSGGSISNQIQRFPFATDVNATAVGTLSQARGQISGQQV